MIKILKILSVIFLVINITEIEVRGQAVNADSSKLITDSFEIPSFEIKKISKDLSISENGKGKATFRIHINKVGEISNYEILSFHFTTIKNKKYSFYQTFDTKNSELKYPQIIKSNEKYFKEYIKKKIIVKKVSEENIKEDNVYFVTVNLK